MAALARRTDGGGTADGDADLDRRDDDGDAASHLAGSLSGNDFFAVAKGAVVYLARHRHGPRRLRATASITPGDSASQGTATTHTLTLAGPVNADDVWTLSLDGTALTPFTVATFSADASAVASDFATRAHARKRLRRVRARQRRLHHEDRPTGAWLPRVAIARDPNAADATVSGILKAKYVDDVELLPAGSHGGGGRHVDDHDRGGRDLPPITTTAAGVADAVDKLVTELGAYTASRDSTTDHLLLESSTRR